MSMMKTETINIEGMSCGHCIAAVRRELESIPVEVKEIAIGHATVEYDPEVVDRARLVQAIDEAGYCAVS